MPHLVVECSARAAEPAALESLLAELVDAFCQLESVDPRAVKGRVNLSSIFQMGEGAPEGFVHVEARLLSGRPVELRQLLSSQLHQILVQHLSGRNLSLTCEVREMDRETYKK